MVVHSLNLNTQETKAEGLLLVQGQSGLGNDFQHTLGYNVRSHL